VIRPAISAAIRAALSSPRFVLGSLSFVLSGPSFVFSVTLTGSNVSLGCRLSISRPLIQQIANLPSLIHYRTVERTVITVASTSLEAAISLESPVLRFLARLHTRNSQCV
jgi:hypothetical protein